jgi:hypothetical protein
LTYCNSIKNTTKKIIEESSRILCFTDLGLSGGPSPCIHDVSVVFSWSSCWVFQNVREFHKAHLKARREALGLEIILFVMSNSVARSKLGIEEPLHLLEVLRRHWREIITMMDGDTSVGEHEDIGICNVCHRKFVKFVKSASPSTSALRFTDIIRREVCRSCRFLPIVMSTTSPDRLLQHTLPCIFSTLFRNRLDSLKLHRRTQLRIVQLKVLILRRNWKSRSMRGISSVALVSAKVVGVGSVVER